MSKNTRNTAFRKVDVDQFEEEKYEEEVLSDEGVTGPNDAEVQSLLSKYPSVRFITVPTMLHEKNTRTCF